MGDLSGRTLGGKYKLLRRLGAGGVGTVYEAVQAVIEQRVAIKILRPEFVGSETLAQRLVQEAKSASAIGHPSIIKIFDVGRTKDGLTYVVMELLAGEELSRFIKRSAPLAEGDAVEISIDVLDALRAAHEKGIIHRDLKPENVFLTPGPHGQRWIKLLDFGIAKVVDRRMSNPRLTQEGTVVGTPCYMSPEHARGAKDLDMRVDVYAAGVMLFEMLTRRVPYDGESYNEVLAKVLEDPFPPPRRYNRNISEGLEAVILRATAKDRAARFPNAEAFIEALEPFLPESRSAILRPTTARFTGSDLPAAPLTANDLEPVLEESVPTVVGERRDDGYDADDVLFTPIPDEPERPSAVSSIPTALLPESGEGRIPASGRPAAGTPPEIGTPSAAMVAVSRQDRRRTFIVLAATIAVVAGVAALLLTRGGGESAPGEPVAVALPAEPPGPNAAPEVDAPRPVPAPEPDAGTVGTPAVPDEAMPAEPDAGVAAAESPDAESEAEADEAAKIVVTLSQLPQGAKVTIDGSRVEGRRIELDRSDDTHVLKVTAPGYETFSRTFPATEDRAITVRMERSGGGAGTAGGAGASSPDAGSRVDALRGNPFLSPGR